MKEVSALLSDCGCTCADSLDIWKLGVPLFQYIAPMAHSIPMAHSMGDIGYMCIQPIAEKFACLNMALRYPHIAKKAMMHEKFTRHNKLQRILGTQNLERKVFSQ